MLELFIAIAVAGILLTLATPSFQRVLAKTAATQTANDLLGDLATARTEAVNRQQTTCLEAVGGKWLDGWQVKVDANGDDDCSDAGDTVVRTHAALDKQFKMSVKRGATSVNQILYASDGSVKDVSAVTEIKLCKDAGNYPQRVQVKVRASGMASSYRDASGGSSC